MNPLAVAGADQLDLQVIVVLQTLLDQDSAVAELAFGVILQLPVGTPELLDLGHFLDTHTAASGRRLDQNRGIFDTKYALVFE